MDTFDPSPYNSFEWMSAGNWYLADSADLAGRAQRAALLYHEYNRIGPTDPERCAEIRRELLAPDSGECTIMAPAILEYGSNTTVGTGVFINFGVTILDIAPVRIGARSMLGPNCQLLTAGHPVDDWEMRSGGWENGTPITIGEDVWLGGGVTVLGGVNIGDRCVVGAGSVVTRDLPADSIAVGSPARVVRSRDETRLERGQVPAGVPVDARGVLPGPEHRT